MSLVRVFRDQLSLNYNAEVLKPDYYKARLLEIQVGRRFWESKSSRQDARTFYQRVVKPLRQLQSRGVVEKLEETTQTDDRTPVAVEIIGRVNLPSHANNTNLLAG